MNTRKLEFKEGTRVFTRDGEEVGRINRFVLDPATNEVTHIVVQKGWLLKEDKVVPFDMIGSATDEQAVLNENIEDFDKLPPFEETHFISVTEMDQEENPKHYERSAKMDYYWYPHPQGLTGYPTYDPNYGLGSYTWPPPETTRNIPDTTIPLKEGSNVISVEGKHVGDVERLFVEPDTGRATHFLISQGLLFKERKLVPAHWVKTVDEKEVHLTVSSSLLERLPAYQEDEAPQRE